MSDADKIYEIRDYRPSDKAFVMSTFLRGLYYGDSWFSGIPKDIFMENYHAIAEVLLTKSLMKIACLCEDPDVILGYSMLSKDMSIIHFVFVKSAFRKQGIARSLIPKHPDSVSHLTQLGRSVLHKIPNCVFNPFNLGV